MSKKARSLARLGNRFAVLGAVEVAAGLVFRSDTMLYAGIHNVTDGPIFHAREHAHAADTEHRHSRANRLRRLAAGTMLIGGLALGYNELEADDTEPENISVLSAIAVTETVANAAALRSLSKNSDRSGAHDDAKMHLVIDSAGSALTMIGVFGSSINPQFDQFGAVGHALLISVAAASTLYHTRSDAPHDHDCHG